MSFEGMKKHSRTGESVKVVRLSAEEQERRIHEAVARRAYEIFEGRGATGSHDREDWFQAESQVLPPFGCGSMLLDCAFWVGTNANAFCEGTIELWVAPSRLTICGKPQGQPRKEMIYHVIELPVEVDPSWVKPKFNDSSLEILLKTSKTEQECRLQAAA